MTAYVIVTYDIVDTKAYEPYVPGVVPLIRQHGGEIVIGEFDAKPLEGKAHDVYVVIKFPSEAAARGWHADPHYEPLKKIRAATCRNANMVIAKAAGL